MTSPGPHGRAGAARGTALLVGAALAVTGCTSSPEPADPSPTTTAAEPTPTPEVVSLPQTPAGVAAAWVLEQLAPGAQTTVEDVSARLTEQALASAPAEQVLTVLEQLRTGAPWTPVEVEESDAGLAVRLSSATGDLLMQVAVVGDGRMDGLLFSEPPPDREPAASWEDLVDEVVGLEARTSLLVAAVDDDGACRPLEGMPAGSAPDESLPIGSMVKLYVLGAVVDAVEAGTLTWETPVTVTDELRSLPSGQLQDAPAGTAVTVREAAELMISISDNTATDLLIDAVGREAVEAAVVDMGHDEPAALSPLATTREFFWLGWGGEPEVRERWRDADAAERRQILAEVPAGAPQVDLATFPTTVVWTSGVDWFATASDLCAAQVALAQRAGTPAGEPVTGIMQANPGAEVDPAQWPSVSFKGGSSVGTMGGSWYAQDADGDVVVVVLQTAAEDAADGVAAGTLAGIAGDALRLAG